MNINISYKNISNYIKMHYPFLIFFFLMLFLHLFMGFYEDDVYFSKVLNDWSFFGFLKYRYLNWTSRVIQDAAMVLLSRPDMILWKILNPIIYTFGVYYIIKIVNKENNKKIVIFGILLFLMYPFYEMGSAGWIATTLTYLWSFSLAVISFMPLINEYYDEKTSRLTYAISILSLIYAVNHEQCCALIFGFSLLYLVNTFIQKKKINYYNLLLILISSLSLLVVITSPGVPLRFAVQLKSKYPQFASFGLIEKSYLGIVPTMGILITDKLIFPIFYIILSISSVLKTKNKYLKYVLYFNIIFILFILGYKTLFDISTLVDTKAFITLFGNNTVFSTLLNGIKLVVGILPQLQNSMVLFNYKGVPNTINVPVILTLFISLYLLGSSCLMLLKTYDKKIFPLILFGAGFMSRFIMGFSPEVFTSGARTAIYFYVILIVLTLMLIKKLYNENKINKKVEHLTTIVFSLFAMLEYGFVLFLTIFLL